MCKWLQYLNQLRTNFKVRSHLISNYILCLNLRENNITTNYSFVYEVQEKKLEGKELFCCTRGVECTALIFDSDDYDEH